MQRQWMKDLRERSPRVHCITKYIKYGDVAKMVLAAGYNHVIPQGQQEVKEVSYIFSRTLRCIFTKCDS